MKQVGTENRTGQRYIGHFDISLKNRLASLREKTLSALHRHPVVGYGNWINGNDYEQTQEVFGILPFDAAVCQDLGMLQYNEQFVKDQHPRHQWLSKQQQVRFAVLPVHTHDERLLFHLYAEHSPLFTSLNGQPDFTGLCKQMNEHADGKSFFYKVRYSNLFNHHGYRNKLSILQLPEHVKTYYKTWQDYQNEKVSVTLSNNAVSRLRHLLENNAGNLPMTSALIPQPLADTIKSPSQPHAVTLTNNGKWQIENLLSTHRLQVACSSIGYRYIQSNSSSTPSQTSSTVGSRKRKADHPPEGDPIHVPVGTAARKARRCMACESTQCPGRWKVDKCTAGQSSIER